MMNVIAQYLYGPFPIIELSDVVLRELTDEDADNYFNYMSKAEMRAFVTKANIPETVDQALKEVRYWRSLFHNKLSFYWAIALKSTDQLIGTAGFNIISYQNLRAEISYDLDYNFWNKGIMLKSIKAILNFADILGIIRIQATVTAYNQRSVKLLERCGFAQEGLLRKYEVVDGAHRDYYMYAKVR